MEQLLTNSQTGPDWERLQPALDEAMADLNDDDREALLLRYFKNHDFCTVGRALGVSDDAAQKRVSRAVERLRELLAKHGIAIGAGGLVALISAHAVQAAPAGLALTLSSAALLAGTTTAATAAATTAVNWINLKTIVAILTSAVVAGSATHVIEQNQADRLRQANQRLQVQAQGLTAEKNEALASATATQDELQRLRDRQSELLRLRGEVAQARTQQKEMAALRDENQKFRTVASSAQIKSGQSQAPNPATLESNRVTCINQLRLIDGASQTAALEYHLTATNIVTAEQILPYIKGNEIPRCPDGGEYTFGILTNLPTCSIPGHAIPTQN